MNKQELIMDRLHQLSALIMKAKLEHQPYSKYQNEFYQVSREYKKIWLKGFTN
jgi:hypothetical protein